LIYTFSYVPGALEENGTTYYFSRIDNIYYIELKPDADLNNHNLTIQQYS